MVMHSQIGALQPDTVAFKAFFMLFSFYLSWNLIYFYNITASKMQTKRLKSPGREAAFGLVCCFAFLGSGFPAFLSPVADSGRLLFTFFALLQGGWKCGNVSRDAETDSGQFDEALLPLVRRRCAVCLVKMVFSQ